MSPALPPHDYPVPRHAGRVVEEWASALAERLGVDPAELREQGDASLEFPAETLRIELMDGSRAEFRHAFFLVDANRRAIAVFTEHCGHHVFPYHEAKVFSDGRLVYAQAGA